MRGVRRVISLLRLSRITGAIGAIANLWFVVLWSRSVEASPQPSGMLIGALFGAAVVGGGLYAYASAMNDLFDLRRDRALGRERPIARGELKPEAAVLYLVFTLIAALAGALSLGTQSVLLALIVATGVAIYNAAGKLVPGIAFLLLASLFASAMLIPNTSMQFLWPVWVTMTHWLLISGAAAIVSRRTPRISARAVWFAIVGYLAASLVVLRVSVLRTGSLWPDWVSLNAGLLVLAAAGLLVARLVIRRGTDRARTSEKILRYGGLWNGVYGTAWLAGQAERDAALILGGLTLFGFVASVTIREFQAMFEQPITYTR